MVRITGSYYDAHTVADKLGYTVNYVYDLCRAGTIKATKVGRVWFIDPSEVERIKALQDEHGRMWVRRGKS